jgi:hypothetical protein
MPKVSAIHATRHPFRKYKKVEKNSQKKKSTLTISKAAALALDIYQTSIKLGELFIYIFFPK